MVPSRSGRLAEIQYMLGPRADSPWLGIAPRESRSPVTPILRPTDRINLQVAALAYHLCRINLGLIMCCAICGF